MSGHWQTEQQLRAVLRAKADSVEVSPDALERLRTRVASDAERQGRQAGPRMALVAALALVVGVSAVALFSQRPEPDAVITASPPVTSERPAETTTTSVSTSITTVSTVSTTAAPGPSTTTPPPKDSTVDSAGPGTQVPNRAPTREEAGTAFLDLLGMDLESQTDADGSVWAVDVADNPTKVAQLHFGNDSDGYWVTSATSDLVTISSPAPGSYLETGVVVQGYAHGFLGLVRIHMSDSGGPATRPLWLDAVVRVDARGADAPFSAVLGASVDVSGWVVVGATPADGGSASFAAVPVEGPRRPHVVYQIAPDDPDGGLVVRSAPSVEAASVGVLEPGTTVSIVAVEGAWAEVIQTDGDRGWVSHRHLRPVVDTAAKEALVAELIIAGTPIDELTWPIGGLVAVGWPGSDSVRTAASLTPEVWDEPFEVTLPSQTTMETSLRELLVVAPWADRYERVAADAVGPYPSINKAIDSLVGGGMVTVISSSASESESGRKLVLAVNGWGEITALLAYPE